MAKRKRNLPPPLPDLPFIVTSFDTVPNFGNVPTIVNVGSGSWSNAQIWSLRRVPSAGDIVAIAPTTTVFYDAVSDAVLNTVVVYGKLSFVTSANTRLTTVNLMVLVGGTLQVGTPTVPVQYTALAEIVIANATIDTDADPKQYGHGLLVWGKVVMCGASMVRTFLRTSVEPLAGHTALTLEALPTDWHSWDRLVIPPTEAFFGVGGEIQVEHAIIASVSGNVVTLATPLIRDHLGANDLNGVLDFTPHVGNLTRNVVVRSENPAGVRGHVFLTDRAEVDIRHVAFKDLGRSTGQPLDNTTLDAQGNVTHVGTNHIGRYSLHLHHVRGPDNPTNTGYQYTLIGNALDGCRRWGLVIHDSHYGLVKDNVVYNAELSGIATEDGSESYNLFDHNFVVHVGGVSPTSDLYAYADGWWIGGAHNYFRDNVVANVFLPWGGTSGYHTPALNVSGIKPIPLFRGADMTDPTQTFLHDITTLPLLEFFRNEAYCLHLGYYNDHTPGPGKAAGGIVLKDFRSWATLGGAGNLYGGHMVVDGLKVRKCSNVGLTVVSGDGLLLKNLDIQGAFWGIVHVVGAGTASDLEIEDSYLRNDMNILVTLAPLGGPPPPLGPEDVSVLHKTTTIRNVLCEAPPSKPLKSIVMSPMSSGAVSRVPCITNTTRVYDYQQQTGADFLVYFREQAPDFIVPFEGDIPEAQYYRRYASLTAGLTNTQCWAAHGRAMAGEIAPAAANDTARAEIDGLTVP